MNKDIATYNKAQNKIYRAICDKLAEEIDGKLPKAESKIWHRTAVWFLEGNPIVGYSVLKGGVQLLFWSGQSFEEDKLTPAGSFKAAGVRYLTAEDVNLRDLARWLRKSKTIQWDYKNIVKRKGKLLRLSKSTKAK